MRITDTVARSIACLWPFGLVPLSPGTAGSAVAVILAPLLFLPLSYMARMGVLAGLYLLGSWAAGRAEKTLGRKDPGQVVIDELVGQWVTYLPFAALGYGELFLGFLFFRVFDVFKPWPVRSSESWFAGGFGIMIDDVLAGAYAALCLGGWTLLAS